MIRDLIEKAQGLLEDTKTRTILIIVGIVVFFGLAIIVKSALTNDDNVGQRASSVAGVPGNIENIPGGDITEQYRNLQLEENASRAEKAKQQGKSSIPTLVGSKNEKVLSLFDENKEAPQRSLKDIAQRKSLAKLQSKQKKLQVLQRKRQTAERKKIVQKEKATINPNYQKEIQDLSQAMGKQSQALFKSWDREQNQAYKVGKLAENDASNFAAENNSYVNSINAEVSLSGSSSSAKATGVSKDGIIKAGTVMFGALKTSINSDEDSPILATIVQGKLKGAQLIGSMTLSENTGRVIIKFNKLSLPSKKNTIDVEIVAIDPESARTALSSEVDNHYLLRYGSLFASSFLEGVSDAVSGQGTETATTPNFIGGITTITKQPTEKSTQQIVMSGLAKVGKKWGEQIGPNFERKPTVTVESGASMGLLFTNDVDLNTKKE